MTIAPYTKQAKTYYQFKANLAVNPLKPLMVTLAKRELRKINNQLLFLNEQLQKFVE